MLDSTLYTNLIIRCKHWIICLVDFLVQQHSVYVRFRNGKVASQSMTARMSHETRQININTRQEEKVNVDGNKFNNATLNDKSIHPPEITALYSVTRVTPRNNNQAQTFTTARYYNTLGN